MPKGPKVESEQKHALRRFSCRFDRDLSIKEYQNIVNLIQSGKAELVDRQSNRITRWKVQIEDINAIAVYDKIRKAVVTFLLPEMINSPKIS